MNYGKAILVLKIVAPVAYCTPSLCLLCQMMPTQGMRLKDHLNRTCWCHTCHIAAAAAAAHSVCWFYACHSVAVAAAADQ
eukprot:1152182-Pelagomonas_calceolata.AAC.15